jgi:hypothetical protein
LSAYRSETFWKTGITGATTPTITLTLSGTASAIDRGFACHEFRGPTAIDQDPGVKSGSGTTTTSNATSTLTATHEYAVGHCVFANAFGTLASPWQQEESAGFGSNVTADQIVTANTALTFSATQGTSGNYLCSVDTFK